jgi:hypothetical protein
MAPPIQYSKFPKSGIAKFVASIGIPFLAALISNTFRSFFPGPSGFFISAPILVGLALWLLVSVGMLLYAAIRMRWRHAGFRLAVLLTAVPLVCIGLRSGDYVHLLALYPHYREMIAANPNGRSEPVKFPWGDDAVSVLDGMQARILVYDTGPTTRAQVDHDLPWEEGLRVYTRHLLGNFYLQLVHTP